MYECGFAEGRERRFVCTSVGSGEGRPPERVFLNLTSPQENT